ncbi:unnamed protein product, partial [Owenia fusiformis]
VMLHIKTEQLDKSQKIHLSLHVLHGPKWHFVSFLTSHYRLHTTFPQVTVTSSDRRQIGLYNGVYTLYQACFISKLNNLTKVRKFSRRYRFHMDRNVILSHF